MKFFSSFWRGYKSVAHKIGVFQSKVILTVFYILLTPFGLFFSLFKDELKMKKISKSSWVDKNKQSSSLESVKTQ